MKLQKMNDHILPSSEMSKTNKPTEFKCSFFYFEWLLDRICDKSHPKERYRSLLENLWIREYYPIIFLDQNRVSDGLTLRSEFNSLKRIPTVNKLSPDELSQPCTVLETLIALSIRIERDILTDDIGDRTSVWFWTMMENMELDIMDERRYDEYYVNTVVDKFLNRHYGPNGEGGPFYIPYSMKDLREVELWMQAMWYITANLT